MGTRYKIINTRKYYCVKLVDTVLKGINHIHPLSSTSSSLAAQRDKVKNILAIRLAYLGDIVLTLPALKALKRFYPNSRLWFLTSTLAAELLESTSNGIDHFIPYDAPWFYEGKWRGRWREYRELRSYLKSINFDLAVDFRADVRNIFFLMYVPGLKNRLSYDSGGGGTLLNHAVRWERYKHKLEFHLDILRKAGIEAQTEYPELTINNTIETATMRYLREASLEKGKYFIIHPGSRTELKIYSWQRFAAVAEELHRESGLIPVITGAAHERHLGDKIERATKGLCINTCGDLTIQEFAGIIYFSTLVISNDTSTIHLASALHTPVLAIFGPSKPRETAPLGDQNKVVALPFVCKYTCDETGCAHPQYKACLENLKKEHIVKAAKQILHEL